MVLDAFQMYVYEWSIWIIFFIFVWIQYFEWKYSNIEYIVIEYLDHIIQNEILNSEEIKYFSYSEMYIKSHEITFLYDCKLFIDNVDYHDHSFKINMIFLLKIYDTRNLIIINIIAFKI